MNEEWIKIYEEQLKWLNLALSRKPINSQGEHIIYTKSAVERIKNQMTIEGNQLGFTQLYLSPKQIQIHSQRIRIVKRFVKLRFRCENRQCPASIRRRNYRQRPYYLHNNWTSYYGLVQYRFFFDRLYRYKGRDPLLVHSFKIYKQRCSKCNQWASSGLYDSTLENLIKLYSLFVKNCMMLSDQQSLITWGKKEKIGQKSSAIQRNDKWHIDELCQACDKGKCCKTARTQRKYKKINEEYEFYNSQEQQ